MKPIVRLNVPKIRANEKAVAVDVEPPKFMTGKGLPKVTGKGVPKLNLGKKPSVLDKKHKWTLTSKSEVPIEDKI